MRLNHPEAVALIADEMIEAARDGSSYDEVRQVGYSVLSEDEVMPGVPEMLDRLQVEPLFEDGTQLITLYSPVGSGAGAAPGEVTHPEGDVEFPSHSEVVEIEVSNTLDRAVQVTSHYHFFEANSQLVFDREAALGMRPDIPACTSVRFEPGETKTVRLRPFGGERRVHGFNSLVEGDVDDAAVRDAALARAAAAGFRDSGRA